MQPRQNPNDKGVTGKDLVVTGGTGLTTGVLGVAVVLSIGGLLAESSGTGAAIGATGGPVGIVIGATAGLLIGLAIGVYLRVKSRRAEMERDQASTPSNKFFRMI